MEKQETMNKLLAVKSKFNYRQLFMIGVLIFITAMDILLDYVTAGFNAAIFKDASYWILLGVTCLSVVFVTLTVRDYYREKEIRENQELVDTQKKIDNAHAELINHNLTTSFEKYVNDMNADRKLKAYTDYLQYTILKTKKKKKREYLQERLEKAEEEIKFMPTRGNYIKISAAKYVKYPRVRIATIFSRVDHIKGDDNDIETHEGKFVGDLLLKKIAMLIAFSIAFSTLFFANGTFSVAILVNTFMKLFRTANSIILGATDGQAFVRGTLLSKMKLRLDFIQKFLEDEKSKRSIEQAE